MHNFTLEGLRTEMQEEEPVLVYLVSGKALRKCMKETWYGPNPGWMQVYLIVSARHAKNYCEKVLTEGQKTLKKI